MNWPVAKGISFKDISILALVAMLFSRLKIRINFGRGHHEEYFFEIILKLGDVVLEAKWFIDISYLELRWLICLTEPNHLCNFGRRPHEEQSCEIF